MGGKCWAGSSVVISPSLLNGRVDLTKKRCSPHLPYKYCLTALQGVGLYCMCLQLSGEEGMDYVVHTSQKEYIWTMAASSGLYYQMAWMYP